MIHITQIYFLLNPPFLIVFFIMILKLCFYNELGASCDEQIMDSRFSCLTFSFSFLFTVFAIYILQ